MLAARARAAAGRAVAAARGATRARTVAPALVVPTAHCLTALLLAQPVSTTGFSLTGAGTAGPPVDGEGEEEDTSSGSTQKAAGAAAGAGPAADSASAGGDVDLPALQEELATLRATRMRLLAEMENTRTIARRDVENAKTYAIQKFAKSLLDVADNLERAVDSVPAEERAEGSLTATLHEGVSATERELLKLLELQGIHKFGAVGEAFDPNRHDAMFQVPPSDGAAPGTIAQVLKQGFTFKDRILRPAQVGAVSD